MKATYLNSGTVEQWPDAGPYPITAVTERIRERIVAGMTRFHVPGKPSFCTQLSLERPGQITLTIELSNRRFDGEWIGHSGVARAYVNRDGTSVSMEFVRHLSQLDHGWIDDYIRSMAHLLVTLPPDWKPLVPVPTGQ